MRLVLILLSLLLHSQNCSNSNSSNSLTTLTASEYAQLQQILASGYDFVNHSIFEIEHGIEEITEGFLDRELHSLIYKNASIDCKSLHLSSEECLADCIRYNDPITLLHDFYYHKEKDIEELKQILKWYAYGASGIGWYDVGNADSCEYYGGTYCYTPITNKYDTSKGIYPLVAIPHGCCAPGSCSPEDAAKVVRLNPYCFIAFEMSYLPIVEEGMGSEQQVVATCENTKRDTTSAGFIITILIFLFFVTMVIIATILYLYRLKSKMLYAVVNDTAAQETQSDTTDLNDDGMEQDQIELEIDIHKTIRDNSSFLRIFSMQCIWDEFVKKRPKGKQKLNFLDGIRVYSIIGVIIGHVWWFFCHAGSNNNKIRPFTNKDIAPNSDEYKYGAASIWITIFPDATWFTVDSFFWLSGLLGSFTMYKIVSKIGGGDISKINKSSYGWIMMSYYARYLRIFPMMMFILLINWKILDQIPDGKTMIYRGIYNDKCNENWWKLLLLIKNLYASRVGGGSGDEMLAHFQPGCMGHLWYVQNDFQMFLLLPFLILIFINNKIYGIISSLIPFIISLIIRIYYGFYYHFGTNPQWPAYEPINGGDGGAQSYYKPWTRMAPYFIGITFTFIMITINERTLNKFELTNKQFYLMTLLTLFGIFALIMWPYEDVKDAPEVRWSWQSHAVYYALSKPVWGLELSLLAFTFVYGHPTGNWINKFLSLEIYQPLGKLTYLMYLVHYLLFIWWLDELDQPPYYSGWYMSMLFFGVLGTTFLCSLVLHLFMEAPINTIVSIYLKNLRDYGCCFCICPRKKKERRDRRTDDLDLNENQHEQIPLDDVRIVHSN